MRPVWYSAQSPLYFLATAFLSGAVAAVLITYLAHGFKQENMSEGVRKLMKGAMPNVVSRLARSGDPVRRGSDLHWALE